MELEGDGDAGCCWFRRDCESLEIALPLTQRPCVPRSQSGLIAAICAFTLWGVLPLYWLQLEFMASSSIERVNTSACISGGLVPPMCQSGVDLC